MVILFTDKEFDDHEDQVIPQRTWQQCWDLMMVCLTPKHPGAKLHRTPWEVFTLQREKWVKSPNNCNIKWVVFFIIQRCKQRTVRAQWKGGEAFWKKEMRWEIGNFYRVSRPYVDLQGWIGDEQGKEQQQSFPGGRNCFSKLQKLKNKQNSWRITHQLFWEGLEDIKGNRIKHIVWKFGQRLILWCNAKHKSKLCVHWTNSQVSVDEWHCVLGSSGLDEAMVAPILFLT